MELAAKLQLQPGQDLTALLAPESLGPALGPFVTSSADSTSALIVFVLDRETLERQRRTIVDAVTGGRLTWVAYPKAGQLGTDLNRDSLAAMLASSGIRPVRQIAIDDAWSALRFRPDQ
jgi:hypothetical protein